MFTLYISQHLIMTYLMQNMDMIPRFLQLPQKDPPKDKFHLSYEDMERRIRMLDEDDEELHRAGARPTLPREFTDNDFDEVSSSDEVTNGPTEWLHKSVGFGVEMQFVQKGTETLLLNASIERASPERCPHHRFWRPGASQTGDIAIAVPARSFLGTEVIATLIIVLVPGRARCSI